MHDAHAILSPMPTPQEQLACLRDEYNNPRCSSRRYYATEFRRLRAKFVRLGMLTEAEAATITLNKDN